MFFTVYKLMLAYFQGARGVPLPEEVTGVPVLPVRTKAEHEFRDIVSPTHEVFVNELVPIYDDEDLKQPKLVRQVCLNPRVESPEPSLKVVQPLYPVVPVSMTYYNDETKVYEAIHWNSQGNFVHIIERPLDDIYEDC
jgi:hypothetical protein